jgi:hypothetical protein
MVVLRTLCAYDEIQSIWLNCDSGELQEERGASTANMKVTRS